MIHVKDKFLKKSSNITGKAVITKVGTEQAEIT